MYEAAASLPVEGDRRSPQGWRRGKDWSIAETRAALKAWFAVQEQGDMTVVAQESEARRAYKRNVELLASQGRWPTGKGEKGKGKQYRHPSPQESIAQRSSNDSASIMSRVSVVVLPAVKKIAALACAAPLAR